MKTRSTPFLALLALTLAALACAIPGLPTTPGGDAGDSDTAIATSVAATLTAIAPTAVPDPLPAALYFLSRDASGVYQVFRLEADGVTRRQMTYEPADVNDYDVSPIDGRLAYESNNQLLLMNADGTGRAALVNGGALGSDQSYFTSRVSQPRWSPDGRTIAFGLNGLNFYDVASGGFTNVLPNQVDFTNGFYFPRALYGPGVYSPDGTRLLVNIGYYEGGDYGVYDLRSGTFNKFQLDSGYGGSCCFPAWTQDNQSVLVASPWLGMISPGLWRFNAATGMGTALLPSEPGDGTFNFAQAPLQMPDGTLYFFFANIPGYPEGSDVPLMLVRSAPDAVGGRSVIYPEALIVSEALWAPDASRVVVASPAPDRRDYRDNTLSLIRLDGAPKLPLAANAHNLRWGP